MSDHETMLAWASLNRDRYPALAKLTEEQNGESRILRLTKPYGRKDGLIVAFDEVLASVLRRRNRDYVVAYAPDYETARVFLTECAAWKPEKSKKQ